MVGADAHRHPPFLTKLYQWSEALPDPINLGLIFRIRVIAGGEFFGIGEVARIDANLLDPLGGLKGSLGLEVNVGDQRDTTTATVEFLADVFEICGIQDSRPYAQP
jgi:hypothetical protein